MMRIFALFIFFFSTVVQAETIVVDNSDAGFSVVSGGWQSSSAVSGAINGSYLAGHALNVTGGAGSVAWTFTVNDSTKTYIVSAQWTSHPNRSSNARYRVFHQNGVNNIDVDQSTQGGEFVNLGEFVGPYRVELDNNPNGQTVSNGWVIADAVQLVRKPEPVPVKTNFGPGYGSDIFTSMIGQLGLFNPHEDDCDTATEVFISLAQGKGFCFEKNERSAIATTFEEARAACLQDGKRLPEPAEWIFACNSYSSSINGLYDNNEWTTNFTSMLFTEWFNDGKQRLMAYVSGGGGASCSYGFPAYIGGLPSSEDPTPRFSANYRCVR